MQKLNLTDEETLALLDLLNTTVQDHRYPVSPHIRTLRGTLAKLRPMVQVLEEGKRVKAEAVVHPGWWSYGNCRRLWASRS